MSQSVQINTTAPDFSLADFDGNLIGLADYKGRKHVILIFNRGFM